MAKEPRFARRALADRIWNAIRSFPYDQQGIVRSVSFTPSFYPDKGYVFLQLRWPESTAGDYETVYRPNRQAVLELACGVAKNKFPHLKKVIGIAIDAPKDKPKNSEDLILVNCDEWPEEQRLKYEEVNKEMKIFETTAVKRGIVHVKNFQTPRHPRRASKSDETHHARAALEENSRDVMGREFEVMRPEVSLSKGVTFRNLRYVSRFSASRTKRRRSSAIAARAAAVAATAVATRACRLTGLFGHGHSAVLSAAARGVNAPRHVPGPGFEVSGTAHPSR